MSRTYWIGTAALAVTFVCAYVPFEHTYSARVEADARRVADAKAAETVLRMRQAEETRERVRLASEARTRAAEEKRRAQREREDRDDQLLERQTVKAEEEQQRLQSEVTAMTEVLRAMRVKLDDLENSAFDEGRKLEREKIERRNLDLETQRATRVLAGQFESSVEAEAVNFVALPEDGRRR